MHMTDSSSDDIKDYFACLGEIWRDITLIEFLMRCAIARHDSEIDKFPKPPYTKGRVYEEYPASFSSELGFGAIAKRFEEIHPEQRIPDELINFRHAVAHGVLAEIDGSGTDELVKFKVIDRKLVTDFVLKMELSRLRQLKQSVREMRRWIALVTTDPIDV